MKQPKRTENNVNDRTPDLVVSPNYLLAISFNWSYITHSFRVMEISRLSEFYLENIWLNSINWIAYQSTT